MKFRTGWGAFVAGFLVITASVHAQSLKIGSKAPPLNFSDWIKGDALEKGKTAGKVVFMECWATWCGPCIQSIPHLTGLQQKYGKDGLVVIGAASPGRGESLSKVKRFIKQRGAAIAYTIAWDKTGDVTDAYMRGVGAMGIPYAFLIDRDGTLVWHGHPSDPAADLVIADVVAGTYDVDSAVRREKIAPMFARMRLTASREDWGGFKSAVEEALKLDPSNNDVLGALVYVYMSDTPVSDDMINMIEQHARDNGDRTDVQFAIARSLLGIPELDKRRPGLALQAAAKAYRSATPPGFQIIAAYARAMFEIGMVDKAIELQKSAVESANGDADKTGLKSVLDYYKACKDLQAESS